MRHGVEPRLVRRLGDVDGGPRASLLEVSWSVSLDVAPANADGPEEVDQTCAEVSTLVSLLCQGGVWMKLTKLFFCLGGKNPGGRDKWEKRKQ